MNVDEIVAALRICNRPKGHRCSECPVFSRYEHRICKATVDRFAADLIESLQAQLATEKRRVDAAVEDLTKLATRPIAPCHSCSKTCVFPATLAPELQPAPWCRDWEWRGVKEENKCAQS